jgi:hypothetical protein
MATPKDASYIICMNIALRMPLTVDQYLAWTRAR